MVGSLPRSPCPQLRSRGQTITSNLSTPSASNFHQTVTRVLRVGSCPALWVYLAVRVDSSRALFRVIRVGCHGCRALPPSAAKPDTHDTRLASPAPALHTVCWGLPNPQSSPLKSRLYIWAVHLSSGPDFGRIATWRSQTSPFGRQEAGLRHDVCVFWLALQPTSGPEGRCTDRRHYCITSGSTGHRPATNSNPIRMHPGMITRSSQRFDRADCPPTRPHR